MHMSYAKKSNIVDTLMMCGKNIFECHYPSTLLTRIATWSFVDCLAFSNKSFIIEVYDTIEVICTSIDDIWSYM